MIPPRIDRKINRTEGCWTWSGAHIPAGYGHVWWDGRMRLVHRVVFEVVIGPIPDGLEPDHLCENKGCCNPAHLQLVTHAENIRRSSKVRRRGTEPRCARGHEFTPDNTYITSRNGRCCKACRRINQQSSKRNRIKESIA